MRKLRTIELKILGLLLSGETLAPRDIAIKLDVANQSIRNRLLFLKNNGFVEYTGYAEYKLSARGRDHLDFISQPSSNQISSQEAKGEVN